jgi:hypothetical protein
VGGIDLQGVVLGAFLLPLRGRIEEGAPVNHQNKL